MSLRQAATIILLREPYEVLMVRRNTSLAFMGGYWVFPGGKLEESDGDVSDAARRELQEEVRIDLDPAAEMVLFARWITPETLPRRFDTFFFLARASDTTGADTPQVDDSEIVEARWVAPATMLTDGSDLAFPTRKNLERLATFTDIDALIADTREREVDPVLPVIVHNDGSSTITAAGHTEPFDGQP